MDRPGAAGRQLLVFFALAAAGCGADLATKHWAFSRDDLLAGGVRWVWTGHAGLQLSLNEGALFGMGQGRVWWFAAFSLAACAVIPWWLFRRGGAQDPMLVAVLGLVMGGVLGNLYDRLGLHGLDWGAFVPSRAGEPIYAVRDFILLAGRWDADPSKRLVWPNFNVADCLLVCGALTLLLLSFRHPTPVTDEDDSAE
ncbi:MAG: peptidase A8 [Planctomycetaceae bacterium]|nr:peptidase A8 [Planctomycetaceae bacterium]